MPVRISTKPSDMVTPPLEPSPSRFTLPVPFGKISMLRFELDTISRASTSKLPPSSGLVSSTTAVMAFVGARPATSVDLCIFLRPPPDVSIAKRTSSAATELISLRLPMALDLKSVPSAINMLSAVLVPRANVVAVIAAGVDPPITAPLIVPPVICTASNVPSSNALTSSARVIFLVVETDVSTMTNKSSAAVFAPVRAVRSEIFAFDIT